MQELLGKKKLLAMKIYLMWTMINWLKDDIKILKVIILEDDITQQHILEWIWYIPSRATELEIHMGHVERDIQRQLAVRAWKMGILARFTYLGIICIWVQFGQYYLGRVIGKEREGQRKGSQSLGKEWTW